MLLNRKEKQILIAEACGYKKGKANVNLDYSSADGFWHEGRFYIGTTHLPDYFGSLDVMHKVEKLIPEDKFGDYKSMLEWVMYLGHFSPEYRVNRLIHATAADKAEAFGRALRLW